MAKLEQLDEVEDKYSNKTKDVKSINKIFVIVDYLFLFIFFVFLCYILLKLLRS